MAPRSHALLNASGSHRWLHCTAAPLLEENFPDSTSEIHMHSQGQQNQKG